MRLEYKIGIGLAALAALGIGGRVAYKRVKAAKAIKDFERGGYDVNTGKKLPKGSTAVENKINLVDTADQIAADMGYIYSIVDPRRFTENDDQVERALLKVPKPLFSELVKIYYQRHKRDLVADLRKDLDRDNYDRVKYLWS